MIKQIGFAYQSAASAAEIHRNLCNGMNNAQPESVSSVPSVVKNTCEYHFSGKKCRFSSLFRHFSIAFLSLFVAFLSIFRYFGHISTTSTTFLPLFLPLLNRLLIRYLSTKVVEVVDFFQKKYWWWLKDAESVISKYP